MILGRSSHQPTIENKFDNVDFNISVESCDYVDIFVEATEELAALESAMYVADVMLEEQVLEGATNIDVLLEGVMSSLYTRLKDAVQKFWAKVKQWFANVKKFFQVLFTHGKEFVKKFKTDIVKAASRVNGFKYQFYPVGGSFGFGPNKPTEIDALAVARGITGDDSNAEAVKKYMESNCWKGEESQAAFNKAFKEKLLGGDSKEEYEDFKQGPSIQTMMAFIENSGTVIKEIEKNESAINKNCKKVVDALTKAENEAAKAVASNGGSLDKAYSLAVELVKATCNHDVAMANTIKECVKTLAKDCESVLKKLLSHRPAKESFSGSEFDGTESILEAALKGL